MSSRRNTGWLSIGLALVGGFVVEPFFAGDAHAIIGRPLTPLSYAGVARRTTRRAVYAGAAVGAYRPYPAPVVAAPAPYYW
jgi:hypothetical protein